MDTNKKAREAYLPDKEDRKEKVIVGINGGLDSLVTAYLLKIQKYELFAVTIVNEFTVAPQSPLSCLIDQSKLDKIQSFCHQLGIPLQIVRPTDEFQESVLDPWVDSKITGTYSHPCWSCHEMRMKILHRKMIEAGASHIATGHYAKIFRHDSLGSVFLHTSNDEKHDQSAILSRLPHEIIESLLLPLSDLQKKEVIKLADNFGFISDQRPGKKDCFKLNADLGAYLQKRIPPKLRKSGEIFDDEEHEKVGVHEGVFSYEYGEPMVLPEQKKNPYFMTGFDYKEKKILTTLSPAYFAKTKILLKDCLVADETPWQEPFKGVVHLGDGQIVECWIRPKALKRAVIEWEGAQKVIEGDILSVAKKAGKNAKIFLTGVVEYLKEKKVQKEENAYKVDTGRDF